MSLDIVGPEVEQYLDWITLTEAFEAGHRLPRAEVSDTFLYREKDTLLTRSAWISGLGIAVKAATVYPENPAAGLPMVNGVVNLLNDTTGMIEALVDFQLVTKWKTAGDSLLAARRLARPDAREILICGAGHVASSMIEAYRAAFPRARITIWNRTHITAEALAARTGARAEESLESAVRGAEIIACTTMASAPYIRGEWLQPGTHLDLIGAYRPDMREVDDETLRRARIFCDSRATTVHHIGEFKDPIARGVISEADIVADYYDIEAGLFARNSPDEITLSKNGGGAHLDLICAQYLLQTWRMKRG